jgi:hypothetical protein
VTDHCGDLLVAKSARESEDVTDAIQTRIRQEIILERNSRRCAAPIAAKIGRDGVKAGLRQRQ